MNLGVLFSGGKDSAYALHMAREKHQVSCLITLISGNEESYMFHTPNIGITKLQAEAIGLPLVRQTTKGEKEEELEDLKEAIGKAKDEYGIEGVVTGAIESVYQATRVQKICHELDIWCFSPLWKKDQLELLKELVEGGFRVMISGIFAYPLDENWLGKIMDREMIEELKKLNQKYEINPSGEGGEIETTVLDAPFFEKKIEIVEHDIWARNYSGVFRINVARLVVK